MVGGATDLGAVDLSDTGLLTVVRSDLERTMGLRVMPEFVRIVRHERGIPQYTIGHEGRLAHLEKILASYAGLYLAGNSYRGVSVNACVADAPRVAARLAEHLRATEQTPAYAIAR
jgi:protoporphyrinogen/coproporphyrinogen III oxidase